MGQAVFVVIGVFVDAVVQMLCKCQINVGTKGLSDPVCWKPGMVCVSKGEVGQVA
jgi:hypothetical protein